MPERRKIQKKRGHILRLADRGMSIKLRTQVTAIHISQIVDGIYPFHFTAVSQKKTNFLSIIDGSESETDEALGQ